MSLSRKCVGLRDGAGVRRRLVLCQVAFGSLVVLSVMVLYFDLRKPAATVSLVAPAPAQPASTVEAPRWSGWLTDLQSATSAAAEGRDILVEFASARDNAAPLETLLQSPDITSLGTHYVLVRLDVTSSRTDAQTVEKTAEWIDKLNLTDLPCLVAFDSAFRPFGVIKAADAATAGDLLIRLHSLEDAKIRRDTHLAAAVKVTGLERAKLFDKAMDDVGPTVESGYPEVMQQIVELDSDGGAGLKARYAARVSEHLVDDGIQHVVYPLVDAGDLHGALEQASRLERNIATTVRQRQLLQAFQAQLYSSLGEKEKALAMMDGAIALDPSTDAASRVRSEKSKLQASGEGGEAPTR